MSELPKLGPAGRRARRQQALDRLQVAWIAALAAAEQSGEVA